jgi:hypothetical protein
MPREITREEEYAILFGDRDDMPPPPDVTLSGTAYILSASIECWHCHKPTQVIALAASNVADDEDGDDGAIAKLTYVEFLPPGLLASVQAVNPRYQLVESKTADGTYFGNACEHCNALQGDHYLNEPEGPFFPMDEVGAAKVQVRELPLQAPIKVTASMSWGGALEEILRLGNRL